MDELKVLEILTEKLVDTYKVPRESIRPEASLVDDLKLDSLDQIEMLMALEDYFGVEISDEEARKIKTVADIVQVAARLHAETA